MKKLLFTLVMALMAVVVMPAQTRIPSIPSNNRNRTNNVTGTYERNGVVYGTGFDWLSERYATINDISNLDAGQVRVLKNSVYARHGYIFKDTRLKKYFSSLGWYRPRKSNISASEMNKYEQYNVTFLKKYE